MIVSRLEFSLWCYRDRVSDFSFTNVREKNEDVFYILIKSVGPAMTGASKQHQTRNS